MTADKGLIQKKTEAMTPAAKNEKAAASINTMMNSVLDKEGMRKRFDDLLGERSAQFISSVVTMVNADEGLQRAFYEAPLTVIQSALKAATFDLPVDQSLGYAYIVPFSNYKKDLGKKVTEASFILGWKGMNQLALRTGVYAKINVTDVREGELKRYDRLTEDIELRFVENEEERNQLPIIGYAGYYRLVNGAEKVIYMSRAAIEAHEKRHRKGQFMGKGWREDFDAMARKTVYRQLIGKWGLMSIDYKNQSQSRNLADAMAADLEIDAPLTVDGGIVSLDEWSGGDDKTPELPATLPWDGETNEDGGGVL